MATGRVREAEDLSYIPVRSSQAAATTEVSAEARSEVDSVADSEVSEAVPSVAVELAEAGKTISDPL